jgi:hypothetical protein
VQALGIACLGCHTLGAGLLVRPQLARHAASSKPPLLALELLSRNKGFAVGGFGPAGIEP